MPVKTISGYGLRDRMLARMKASEAKYMEEVKLTDPNAVKITLNTKLILFAINNFGSGNHPVATEDTLPYFSKDYIIDCLTYLAESAKVRKTVAVEALTIAKILEGVNEWN